MEDTSVEFYFAFICSGWRGWIVVAGLEQVQNVNDEVLDFSLCHSFSLRSPILTICIYSTDSSEDPTLFEQPEISRVRCFSFKWGWLYTRSDNMVGVEHKWKGWGTRGQWLWPQTEMVRTWVKPVVRRVSLCREKWRDGAPSPVGSGKHGRSKEVSVMPLQLALPPTRLCVETAAQAKLIGYVSSFHRNTHQPVLSGCVRKSQV